MQRKDYLRLAALVLYGGFIWARDPAWVPVAGDTLPILAGFGLFVWVLGPWRFAREYAAASARLLVLGAVLAAVGILLDSTFLLAASWTALLAAWLRPRLAKPEPEGFGKALVLPLLSFPWLVTDLPRLGWWLRLSAASASAKLLGIAGFQVLRQGTFVTVNGFSVSVEPACSGLNGLQAILAAGTAVAFLKLRRTRSFWWALAALPIAAWLANLGRIVFAEVAGAALPRDFALNWLGPLHLLAGWLALLAMFGMCWALFSRIGAWAEGRPRRAPGRDRGLWLDLALAAYAGWLCRGLIPTWIHSPFDRLAWLAFLIWIWPLLWRGRWVRACRASGRFWPAAIGLAGAVLGQLGDVHFLLQAALVLILLRGLSPIEAGALALGALSWFPAFGWAGSRLAIEPSLVSVLRLLLATAAAAVSMLNARAGAVAESPEYVPSG